MARFNFVVYSNPVEGREGEYNDWYSNRHLGDLLAIPGVLAARRYKLAPTQVSGTPPQPYQYLAIYEIEADNVQAFLDVMMQRVAGGAIPVTTAMSADVFPVFWEAL